MPEVKRYHATETGLVEGQALGRINVVLAVDHDRVAADADRLRAELECSRGDFVQLERISDALQQHLTAADERADRLEAGIKWETERNALLLTSLTEAEDMLSITSLEAGQRIDQLEGLLREALPALDLAAGAFKSVKPIRNKVRAELKPTEGIKS